MGLWSIRTIGILYGYLLYCFILLNSPYLLVFGDNRVMCYTGADDVASGAGEA